MLKTSPQYEQLKEAMALIRELKIPEHLQEKALVHLLQGAAPPIRTPASETSVHSTGQAGTGAIREFIEKYQPKGAVEEIPALLYWARENEKAESFSEDDIVALYRRGAIRPPKHVAQSMRDLSSKRYLRLRAVSDKTGHVTLSRTGEDFVLHDLMKRKAN